MNTSYNLRPAHRSDARAIAELTDLAGEGIPMRLWEASRKDGVEALDHGAARAAREGVPFCYENATVAEADRQVVGMVLAYPLEAEEIDLSEVPEIVRPLLVLEAAAPDTFYINAVGVRSAYRGEGIGTLLIQSSEAAGRIAGCRAASLIVADDNPARELYARLGYGERAREPVVPFEGFPHEGDWILMVKDIAR